MAVTIARGVGLPSAGSGPSRVRARGSGGRSPRPATEVVLADLDEEAVEHARSMLTALPTLPAAAAQAPVSTAPAAGIKITLNARRDSPMSASKSRGRPPQARFVVRVVAKRKASDEVLVELDGGGSPWCSGVARKGHLPGRRFRRSVRSPWSTRPRARLVTSRGEVHVVLGLPGPIATPTPADRTKRADDGGRDHTPAQP